MTQSQSLKTKFSKTIIALYVTLGVLVYIAFHVVTLNIVRHLSPPLSDLMQEKAGWRSSGRGWNAFCG